MKAHAYLTQNSDQELRVTVHRDAGLYSDGTPGESWTFPVTDSGKIHLFGAQPEQPFIDADRILAENGWTREGPWMIGDIVTETRARIARTT